MINSLAIWRENRFVYWFLIAANLTHWAAVFIGEYLLLSLSGFKLTLRSRLQLLLRPTHPHLTQRVPIAVISNRGR